MKSPMNSPVRVMRIIARMNVGGPAVQVAGLMRGFNSIDFDHRLYTGFCARNESDYLDTVAVDVKAVPESRAAVKSKTVAEATAEVQDCV